MDPSQEKSSGQKTQAPTAAQLLAAADVRKILAGMKRAADEVSDLEIPEGSRPMLSLDRTRHRANNPETGPQQQQSSDPVRSSLTEDGPKSESDENRLPVPKQQQLDFPSPSLQPSLPQVASNPICNAIDSTIPQPPVEAATVPQPLVAAASLLASSHSRGPDSVMISSEPFTSLSGLDRRSPIVQAMLREAFSEGRSEGRQESQTKLDEAESKVEELRKRLDPSKLKAAYDRGFREGGLEGYNKYSLHPETKASDERLAFEKIIKEKDQAIQNQQMTMARYEQELKARRRRTQELEQRSSLPTPQQPNPQQGQNISGQQILEAEARFSTQGQELSVAKSQNEHMRADLSNWQVQWGLITADLERWKAAFSAKATQLDACQRQLEHSNSELHDSKEEATQLASSKSEEIASLKAAVAAERSAKIESAKALNEELKSNSKQVQDGKDEIDALTSQNTELIKGFGELEETVSRQDRELQQLSAESEELTRKLQERKEEDERAPLSLNNAPSQDGDEQAEEIDDLPAEFAEETAAADIELVRIMLEKDRVKNEAENLRRENRVTATLERMEETEGRRRQILIDELEDKDAQLDDAQKQIRDLTERLLVASLSQPSQSSPSPLPSSPPPEASQSPNAHPPPPTAAISPPAPGIASWFRFPRLIPATAPRRLLIMLFIFLFAFLFLIPFHYSLGSRPTIENTDSGPVINEVLAWPEEVVTASEAYDEGRRRWQAWAMTNWERNERIARGEQLEEEYRPIPGFDD